MSSKLKTASAILDVYIASVQGEPYHKQYSKYPELLRKLVKSDVATEKAMNGYFSDLVDRVYTYIDWSKYSTRAASEFIPMNLEPEIPVLAALLAKTLTSAVVAGGQYTEKEFDTVIGWSEKEQPAIKFLRNYVFKLSGQLNKTTLNRLNESLRTSIEFGESQVLATVRMQKVIKDPIRAAVIAHTESVRAFTEGRLQVGKMIGVTHKEWSATFKACPICGSLDGVKIPFDDLFNEVYAGPPAHPNCRCLVRLHM